MKQFIVLFTVFLAGIIYCQAFTEVSAGLPNLNSSSADWGDYDNDGDLDLLLSGSYTGNVTQIYKNNGGTFSSISAGFTAISAGAAVWGDFDNDGDLDAAISGSTGTGYFADIYRNTGGIFTAISSGITATGTGSLDWGDYDNDGDLDLLMIGTSSSGAVTKIYRNDQGIFTDTAASLPTGTSGQAVWGDYDKDGDLDIAIMGNVAGGLTEIYRNDGNGVFTDINAGMQAVFSGSIAWGDYDSDGDPDILLTGRDSGNIKYTKIYRNDITAFVDIGAALQSVCYGKGLWGDFDNDGDLDILITGHDGTTSTSRVYRNDGGTVFTDISATLTGIYQGPAVWGDYDKDNDLDFLIAGYTGSQVLTKLYRNNSAAKNTAPDVPANISSAVTGYDAVLSWNKATDGQTPQNGLSYNIYISSVPGSCDTKPPMSSISTGYRKIIRSGNAHQNSSWAVNDLTPGTYYWSVQSVDNAFAGSAFAAEGSFYTAPVAPVISSSDATSTSFKVNWENTEGLTEYALELDDTDDFSSLITNVFISGFAYTSYTFNGLDPNTVYYCRVRAGNSSGYSSYSNVLSAATLPLFTDIGAAISGAEKGNTVWGDYDNDGDLDVLITGYSASEYIFSRIYRNDNGYFTDINAGLPGVNTSTAAWGDYDNDGDLDIVLSGYTGSSYISKICNNNGGVFTDINAGLQGMFNGSSSWGDYDNDGDLDLLLTGYNGTNFTMVYRNDHGIFNSVSTGMIALSNGCGTWADYDKDGDLDVLVTGSNGTYYAYLYRNNNGVFSFAWGAGTGLNYSSAAWGDYNKDGYPDILLTGWNGTDYTKIYKNTAGTITDSGISIAGVSYGSGEWGDYDNDGDQDILLTGKSGALVVSRIYRNDGTTFTNISADLSGVQNSKAKWGDYDNDGDLDIVLSGYTGSDYITRIYRNNTGIQNTAPDVPANLTGTPDGYSAVLSWDSAADMQTNFQSLSYNLYISSEPGSCDTKSPMSDISSGYRKVVSLGNSNLTNSWTVKNLPPGTYYWSVQSVDGCYAGSAFAAERSFYTAPVAPVPVCTDTTSTSLSFVWNAVSGATSYALEFDDNSDFSSPIYNFGTTGLNLNAQDLDPSTAYYFRVRSCNASGYSSYSAVLNTATKSMFIETDPGITNVYYSSSQWGDYDSDGDLDLLLMGYTGSGYFTKIYRNDSGTLVYYTDLTWGLSQGNILWNDFDNDGDLDVIETGMSGALPTTQAYRNNSGVFENFNIGIGAQSYPSLDAADFDNDGDTDFLHQGTNGIMLYKNNNGICSQVTSAGFSPGLANGTVDWCDYDNDGDMDVLITGFKGSQSPFYFSKIYRNDSGVFTDISAGLTGLSDSSADWGDYDRDGDLDIIITGYNNVSPYYYTIVYRNDSGVFTDISAGLPGVRYGSCEWGDYNNDNQPDILISGYTGTGYISKIYQNSFGTFSEVNAGFTGIYRGSAGWVDYDNDNDLDVFISGSGGISAVSKLYINNTGDENTKPSKPGQLVTSAENDSLKLSFGSIYSDPTLTYNVEITLNGSNITPSQAINQTGYRKIVKRGSIAKSRKFFILGIDNLPQEEKSFKWKVQAVDNSFAGSEFSSSNNFFLSSPRDLSLSVNTVMTETDLLKWEYANADQVGHYIIQLDDDPYFGSPVEEIYDPSAKTVNTLKSDDSKTLYLYLAVNELADFGELISNETYYYRIKPVYTKTGCVTIFSETPRNFLYNPTGTPPNPPVSGFNPSNDDIESSLPKISWNNADDPDGHAEDLYYICQLDTLTAFTTVQYADTTAVGITSIQVASDLPVGYRYYYRVKTVDLDGLQSAWSADQSFIVVMPPQDLKITDDGTNVNLTWDAVPSNTKGVVYTVYSSVSPYAEFPSGWTVAAAQLASPSWSEPHSAVKKFYRVTAGSSSK